MAEKPKTTYRISFAMILIILFIAAVVDLLTLIPLIGTLMGPAYFAVFSWYLYHTGHGLLNWRTVATEATSVLIEILPVTQALPAILCATVIIIFISRTEDKTGLSISQIAGGKGVRLPDKALPLNKDGVRAPRNP